MFLPHPWRIVLIYFGCKLNVHKLCYGCLSLRIAMAINTTELTCVIIPIAAAIS